MRGALVTFDNEVGTAGHLEIAPEILRNSTNQEGRLSAGHVQDPCQHCRRGCLSVRSRDDNRVLPANEKFLHGLGHRRVAQTRVQDIFHFDIASGKRVADNDQVRRSLLQVLGVVALEHLNA